MAYDGVMATSFATPMPPRTQREHESTTRGDNFGQIDRTAKKPAGPDRIKAADVNAQWFWRDPNNHALGGEAMCMHWRKPGPNGYRWIVVGKRVRKMTRKELRRTNWTLAEVLRWRRGPHMNAARPRTYGEMLTYAKSKGVVIVLELKSPEFAIPTVAAHLVATARAKNHPAWFMALINMAVPNGKAIAIHEAGGQFALIFGRFRRLARVQPRNWSSWSYAVSRIWGPATWAHAGRKPA